MAHKKILLKSSKGYSKDFKIITLIFMEDHQLKCYLKINLNSLTDISLNISNHLL